MRISGSCDVRHGRDMSGYVISGGGRRRRRPSSRTPGTVTRKSGRAAVHARSLPGMCEPVPADHGGQVPAAVRRSRPGARTGGRIIWRQNARGAR